MKRTDYGVQVKTWNVSLLIIVSNLLISCTTPRMEPVMEVSTLDLSTYSQEKPNEPVHLLFIHHSTGGQLLADKGEISGPLSQNCIYATHPNGGGLRSLLEENNYIVHEASYGSVIGNETDVCHWNRKFRDHMEEILKCKQQDELFKDETENSIIIFKSCFPNSWITSDGKRPGDPDSCEKSTANYKAVYNNLLNYFKQQPDTLFVVFTAPPLAEPVLYKRDKLMNSLKTFLCRQDTVEKIGHRTRLFNNWLKDMKNGWLKGYDQKNVVVFDYYDVLTDYGRMNWSAYPTQEGKDSHPSSDGNVRTAQEFVPFLNQALRRMGS